MGPKITFRLKVKGPLGPSYSFYTDAPYTPGHILTEREAEALNAQRAECIQDKVRAGAFAEELKIAGDSLLDEEALSRVQREIDRIGENFEFGRSTRPTYSRLGAVDKEARAIAREEVEASLRVGGLILEEEVVENLVLQASKSKKILDEARARVEARARIAINALEELDNL